MADLVLARGTLVDVGDLDSARRGFVLATPDQSLTLLGIAEADARVVGAHLYGGAEIVLRLDADRAPAASEERAHNARAFRRYAALCEAVYAAERGAPIDQAALAANAGEFVATALCRIAARADARRVDLSVWVRRRDVLDLCHREGATYGKPLRPVALALSIVGNLVLDGLELPPEQRDADDATRIAHEAMEQGLVACDWTRLRAELAEEERDAALEQLASAGETAIAAMSTGLAECERLRERAELLYAEVLTGGDRVVRAEAEVESLRRRSADDVERARAEGRAEADAVARHGGELSRQLAAARDDLEAARIEVTSLRARPEPASALDELALARLVERAAVAGARKAAALTRDAARLLEFADEHGGVDAVIRDARGAARLRKAVGE